MKGYDKCDDWEKRVIDEKNELDDKLKKLIQFRQTERFKLLPTQEVKRMNRQKDYMCLYSNVLEERILSFCEPPEASDALPPSE